MSEKHKEISLKYNKRKKNKEYIQKNFNNIKWRNGTIINCIGLTDFLFYIIYI